MTQAHTRSRCCGLKQIRFLSFKFVWNVKPPEWPFLARENSVCPSLQWKCGPAALHWVKQWNKCGPSALHCSESAGLRPFIEWKWTVITFTVWAMAKDYQCERNGRDKKFFWSICISFRTGPLFGLWVNLSVCSHAPTVYQTTISRFLYNFFRMWPLIFVSTWCTK